MSNDAITLWTGGGLVAAGAVVSALVTNLLGARRDRRRYEHEQEAARETHSHEHAMAREARRQERLERTYLELLAYLSHSLDWAKSVRPMWGPVPAPDPLPPEEPAQLEVARSLSPIRQERLSAETASCRCSWRAALTLAPPRQEARIYPKVVLMAGSVGRARAALPPAREIALRDGTPILVRPILPQDKERLREGLTRLSRASRYRRFLTALDHLSDAQVRYFTEIDYKNHMAWVALDPTQPAQPGLGVARYVRLPDDLTTAEAAVTVLDQYQGRGIGTILLEVLAASARQHGIERFRAYVLAENVTMVEILRGLGATVVRDGSLLRVDVPIPTSPEELPDTPTGRVFKAVAEQAMPPFRLRYPGTPDQEASTPSA